MLIWGLFRVDANLKQATIGEGSVGTWKGVGITYYNAHLVDTVVTAKAGGEQYSDSISHISDSTVTFRGSTIAFESAALPDMLFYLVPTLTLITTGYLIAQSLNGADIVESATHGAGVVVGYLPLTVAGIFLFKYSVSGAITVVNQTDIVTGCLLMGIVWPTVCGASGGVVWSRLGSNATSGTGRAEPTLTRRTVLGGGLLVLGAGAMTRVLNVGELIGRSGLTGPTGEVVENTYDDIEVIDHYLRNTTALGTEAVSTVATVENTGDSKVAVNLKAMLYSGEETVFAANEFPTEAELSPGTQSEMKTWFEGRVSDIARYELYFDAQFN